MSSFAWMRVLESSAERYDRGMRLLSRGRIGEVYRRVAEVAVAQDAATAAASGSQGPASGAEARASAADGPWPRVLDVGCGTGEVALACAALGADVIGIDRNAGMLEVARSKPPPDRRGGRVRWLELGAAEIEDRFAPASFDAVVSCLALSEMSDEERAYTLETALSRLVAGGRLVVADAVEPRRTLRRRLRRLAVAPVAALAYLLTQVRTRPLSALPESVAAAGFVTVAEQRLWGDSFAIVSARAPAMDGGPGRGQAARPPDRAEQAP